MWPLTYCGGNVLARSSISVTQRTGCLAESEKDKHDCLSFSVSLSVNTDSCLPPLSLLFFFFFLCWKYLFSDWLMIPLLLCTFSAQAWCCTMICLYPLSLEYHLNCYFFLWNKLYMFIYVQSKFYASGHWIDSFIVLVWCLGL